MRMGVLERMLSHISLDTQDRVTAIRGPQSLGMLAHPRTQSHLFLMCRLITFWSNIVSLWVLRNPRTGKVAHVEKSYDMTPDFSHHDSTTHGGCGSPYRLNTNRVRTTQDPSQHKGPKQNQDGQDILIWGNARPPYQASTAWCWRQEVPGA